MRIDTEIRSRDETFEEKAKHNNLLGLCGSGNRTGSNPDFQLAKNGLNELLSWQ